MNYDVKLKPLIILSNYLSLSMWIVENGVCMDSERQFCMGLLLESKMDSNLSWTGPLSR
jgi:hypothetical protein